MSAAGALVSSAGHPTSAKLGGTRALVTALAAVALAELLLVRIGSRTAIHIPALPELRAPYSALVTVGDAALVLAQALAIVALVAIAGEAWSRGDARGRSLVGLLGLFVVGALATRFAWGTPGIGQSLTLGAVLGLAIASMGGRAAAVLGLYAVAWLLLGGHTALQGLGVTPGVVGRWLLWLGEAAALAIPVLAIGASRPRGRRAWLAGIVAGAIVTTAMVGPSGWTFRFLSLWNLGLAGTFPPLAYGAAVAVGVAVLASAPRSSLLPVTLLLAGGLGLHNTYQSSLVVVGLASLALGAIRPPARQ